MAVMFVLVLVVGAVAAATRVRRSRAAAAKALSVAEPLESTRVVDHLSAHDRKTSAPGAGPSAGPGPEPRRWDTPHTVEVIAITEDSPIYHLLPATAAQPESVV